MIKRTHSCGDLRDSDAGASVRLCGWVNTYRAISPIAAFGGEKMSGYGREAGFQAMYDFTRPKTVWMNLSDEPLSSPFQPR